MENTMWICMQIAIKISHNLKPCLHYNILSTAWVPLFLGTPRQMYLLVLGTTKKLSTGADVKPELHRLHLSKLAVPCQKKAATVPIFQLCCNVPD